MLVLADANTVRVLPRGLLRLLAARAPRTGEGGVYGAGLAKPTKRGVNGIVWPCGWPGLIPFLDFGGSRSIRQIARFATLTLSQ